MKLLIIDSSISETGHNADYNASIKNAVEKSPSYKKIDLLMVKKKIKFSYCLTLS